MQTPQEIWLQIYCSILESTDSKLFVGTTTYQEDILFRAAALADKAVLYYNTRHQTTKKESTK